MSLDQRFAEFKAATPPDLWDEVERRVGSASLAELPVPWVLRAERDQAEVQTWSALAPWAPMGREPPARAAGSARRRIKRIGIRSKTQSN